MVLSLICLLSAGAPQEEVAFSARFYYPPGDKRTSYSQIYVSSLDGSHRRQLSSGKSEHIAPQWIGQTRLAWVTLPQKSEGKSTLEIYDLAKGKVVVRKQLSGDLFVSGQPERGVPTLEGKSGRFLVGSSGQLSTVKHPNVVSYWDPPYKIEVDGKELVWKFDQGGGSGLSYTFGNDQKSLKLDATPNRFYCEDGKTLYLVAMLGGASAGSEMFVYRLNPEAGELKEILRDVNNVDFDASSRYWSGVEAYRPMSKYGKDKNVWTSSVYVGDLKTGKRWKIASGLVFGESSQIRPGI